LQSNWETVYTATSSNEAYNNIKHILLDVLNRHAPFTSKQVKGKPSPWLDANVKQQMNTRDQLLRKAQKSKSINDWNAYRRLRNFVTNLINRTKRNFFTSKLQETRSKPEQFWKIVKNVFPVKQPVSITTKSFKIHDESITDKKTIAREFCKFFSSVASTLKKKSFPLTNFVWRYNQPQESDVIEFTFRDVTEIEVLKHLKKLKRKCATGLDNLPSSYLKDISYVLAKPLAYVINMSL